MGLTTTFRVNGWMLADVTSFSHTLHSLPADQPGGSRMEIGTLHPSHATLAPAEPTARPTRGSARIPAKRFWPTEISLSPTHGSPEASRNKWANAHSGRQSASPMKELRTPCTPVTSVPETVTAETTPHSNTGPTHCPQICIMVLGPGPHSLFTNTPKRQNPWPQRSKPPPTCPAKAIPLSNVIPKNSTREQHERRSPYKDKAGSAPTANRDLENTTTPVFSGPSFTPHLAHHPASPPRSPTNTPPPNQCLHSQPTGRRHPQTATCQPGGDRDLACH